MGYVGVPPQSGFITTAKQRVTSSTNNYVDLDHSISSLADVIVWVNFVKQDSTNLTLTSSSRITLGATLQNSDIVEISFLGKAVATQSPPIGGVSNDMLAGSITGEKLTDATITSSKIASGVIPTSRPNVNPLIINGDMAVAQRGTSFTGVSSGSNFPVDRFEFYPTNLGTYTIIQEALTSGEAYNNGFRTALRIDTTTADASPASTDYAILRTKFEGQDLQMIKKGTANAEKLTLAFWVKSNKTTTGQVNLFDIDNNRLVSGTYTISSANTWQKKIINFSADTTGAFDNNNALSLVVEFFLDGGSNFTSGTAPTSWEAQSNGDRNANNFAIGSSTDNDFAITGVQLEVGEYTSSTLPPFQHESFGDNLARCQRYYFKNNTVSASMPFASGVVSGTTNSRAVMFYPQPMRSPPSLNKSSSTDFKVFCGSTNVDSTNVAFYYPNNYQALLYVDVSSGLTNGQGAVIIDDGGGNAYIEGNAEL